MSRRTYASLAAASIVTLWLLTACSPDKETTKTVAPNGVRTTTIEPGTAGGSVDQTVTATVLVKAVDPVTRRVTLQDADNDIATFTAGPEVKNLKQLKPGDKVTATVHQHLTVYVDPGPGDTPGSTYAAALATARKGDKPGAVIAEEYETVATVTRIEPQWRTATLRFSDGTSHAIPVRPDVDLARYKVGDTVVIRVTSGLSLLTSKP